MRLDRGTIEAIKAIGHDRVVIHELGAFSCKVTPDAQFGDKGTKMQDAAIVYGVKSIVMLGDIYLTAPYVLVDLKDD